MAWGRINAFTHRISMVFILIQLFTTTCVTLGLFHMGNPGQPAANRPVSDPIPTLSAGTAKSPSNPVEAAVRDLGVGRFPLGPSNGLIRDARGLLGDAGGVGGCRIRPPLLTLKRHENLKLSQEGDVIMWLEGWKPSSARGQVGNVG